MDENKEAWDLWVACETQWRTSGFGPVGLDYSILPWMADTLNIDLSLCTLKKIQALEKADLAIHRERIKAQREEADDGVFNRERQGGNKAGQSSRRYAKRRG